MSWSRRSMQVIGYLTRRAEDCFRGHKGTIKKIEVSGGTPQVICKAQVGRATWNRTGDILFSAGGNAPIYRVSAAGGVPGEVTQLRAEGKGLGHARPQFLPGDRHFLFLSISGDNKFTAIVGSLDSKETKPLMTVESAVFYSPPGYLVFVRQGNLVAQRFDLDSLEVQGEPAQIAPAPSPSPIGSISTSISRNGVLANPGEFGRDRDQPVWYSRDGRIGENIAEPGTYYNPSVSLGWETHRSGTVRQRFITC